MFLGMTGTGRWSASERPQNWRQTILYFYPNGMAPLTAILSKMGEESVDDPHFHWFTKTLPFQRGVIGGVYTDAAMANLYVAGGAAGDQLFVNITTAAQAQEFRKGHIVMFRVSTDLDTDCLARVESVIINGANSMVSVTLLEADDNSTLHDISDSDVLLVVGNSNAEGAEMPDVISYDVDEWYNYTQIFRTPLEITRTARKTRLRTGDAYQRMKKEALELHSIEMEKGFLWGIRSLGAGLNGQPERTTLGIINAIRAGAPGNIFNFATDVNYSGQTWLQGGEHFLDTYLEQIFRFGSKEKLCLLGSGAQLGIDRLIKNGATMNLTPGDASVTWGIHTTRWLTSFGTIHLVTHPLFNYEPTMRNIMVITEPRLLKYKYIDDTMFFSESSSKSTPQGHGHGRIDGTKEEYLTECGLEYHHPTAMGVFYGVGSDSGLTPTTT